MAVIVVGDFDPAAIETLIKAHFGIDPGGRCRRRPRPVYDVPDQPGTRYTIATDPEATADDGRRLDARWRRAISRRSAPIVSRRSSGRFRGAALGPARGDGAEARRAVSRRADEPRDLRPVGRGHDAQRARARRRRREGTGGALHRSRSRRPVRLHADASSIATGCRSCAVFEQLASSTDEHTSESLADEFIRNFMQQEPIPGIAYEYALVRRFMPEITLADVNGLARDWVPDRNRVVVGERAEEGRRGRARPRRRWRRSSRTPAAAR